MTNKLITYRYHAVLRMRQRGFRREDVRWLLAKGLPAEVDDEGTEQRSARRGHLGKREAKVIFVETALRIEIVTIMWIE